MSYLGSNPNVGTSKKLDGLTFNGSTTTFAMTCNGIAITTAFAEQVMVSLNGVVQEPNQSYLVSSGNIVFSVAPASTDTFFGVVFGQAFNVAQSFLPVALPVTVVAGTTASTFNWNHYVMTNAGICTATLPASPNAGDTVWITFTNGRTDNVVARNGQTIMGVAEDMEVDAPGITIELRFINSDWRFV